MQTLFEVKNIRSIEQIKLSIDLSKAILSSVQIKLELLCD